MEKKIFLLADDDTDDREMFCEALSSINENIVCHAVAHGREAMNTLHHPDGKPELIFLDINMPVMSGWECLEKLKADEQCCEIPVIIISTSSHQREIDIAKRLGALCYFTKPYHFNELTEMLRHIVTNLGAGLPAALRKMQEGGSPYIHTWEGEKN